VTGQEHQIFIPHASEGDRLFPENILEQPNVIANSCFLQIWRNIFTLPQDRCPCPGT
jgi:hypothetical protein